MKIPRAKAGGFFFMRYHSAAQVKSDVPECGPRRDRLSIREGLTPARTEMP